MEAKDMFLNDSAFIYSLTTSYFLITYIYAFTRIPHITSIYSVTFSALILPTNHFVIKIRPSFHWWDITAAILLRKKERELEITQGYTQCDVV